MSVDADEARAALSDISDRDRQVRVAAVRASMPWWYVSTMAALLVLVGVADDVDSIDVTYVFCAISIFASLAQTRFTIQLPLSVTTHWAILLVSAVMLVVLTGVYFGVRYGAARAGLSMPGTVGGAAMAAAFLAHVPFFGWAYRKAVGVAS